MQKNRKALFWRGFFYAVGIVCIAIGVTLNTKTGLGVAPVTSLPFTVAGIFEWKFPVVVFFIYSAMMLVEMLLVGKDWKWRDNLQLVFSFVLSALLDVAGRLFQIQFDALWQNLLVMAAGVVFSGIGVAMTVSMELLPVPPDGLAFAMGKRLKKGTGLGKNLLDCMCVATSCLLELVFRGKIVSIGIGTVVAMIFVGRTVAVFHHFFLKKMRATAGLS